ncbi:ABC-three component system middle component 2 [Streptomyces sp. NPDC090112]|uniref:ABC-three component system middle component 2 n=1 Tax=Streptomyces sp. NPDC090112 TaxID=3365949 RepID=UPI0037F64B5F
MSPPGERRPPYLVPGGRTVTPLNSPLEVGVRALVLLAESHPRPLDLAQLVALDYLVLHSGEFNGPHSLHPDLPVRAGELGRKRELLEQGLLVLIRAGLADIVSGEGGLMYAATETGPTFVEVLEAPYVTSLRERAEWALHHFGSPAHARSVTNQIINRAASGSASEGAGHG